MHQALHAVAEDAPMDVKQPEQPLVEEYSQETGNMIVNRAMV